MKKEEEREISPVALIIPIFGVLGLGAALALAAAGPPPPPPGKASLYGKVTDSLTGNPIEDVLVTLDGLSAYTNPSGDYAFLDLEPGAYQGSASKEGYETAYF